MNLTKQEFLVLLKRKTTILSLLVLLFGTVWMGILAVDQGKRILDGNHVIQGREAILYEQREQKEIEGEMKNKDIQALLQHLYEYNQQTPMTLEEKVSYLYSAKNIKYEPYIDFLINLLRENPTALTNDSAYDSIYTLGARLVNIYPQWEARIIQETASSKMNVKSTLQDAKIPFKFESGSFVRVALSKFQDTMLLFYIIIAILLASIFSKDRVLKTDQVFMTTNLGNKKLRKAKCNAAIGCTSLLYLCTMLLYHGVIAAQIGIDGLSTSIQLALQTLSPYTFTSLQAYCLILIFAYVVNLTITMILLYVSYKTKKAYVVIFMAFLLNFVSYMMIQSMDVSGVLSYIAMFLPFGIMENRLIFSYCNVSFLNQSIWFPWIVVVMQVMFVIGLRLRILSRD